MTLKPKILYLDQNAWIALARGAWDKVEYPQEHAALSVVVDAVRAGHITVPLSFTNQYETMKIDIPERRAHLARVQVTLSGARVLRSRRKILEVMLLQHIGKASGLEVPPPSDGWFLSDLWFEAAAEMEWGVFDDTITPNFAELVRSQPQKTLYGYLFGFDETSRKAAIRRKTAADLELLGRLEVRRRRCAGETFALRLRAYSAQLLIDEVDNILSLVKKQGAPWRTVGEMGPKLTKSFVTDVPIMNVERQLVVRLEDQPRATNENDLRDMAAFIAVLPLVDIIVGEKQFVNLSRQARLDVQYGARLLTSVHQLSPDMLAQR